ncbi:MAG: MarR family winged helix-turn-helix transcriptional regulator [Candidatus Kapaibacterium sp.]|nr:winged helix-turn-helix transcriptional regulator [Ignavibacteriota bacterium]MCB9220334.1 winged helix-turn-helix transcriptional regulator [Ignavibacteria bacterium]
MNKSVYNLDNQNSNLSSKITVALERISEAYRVLLWEKAKEFKLSPIQIQILVFVNSHKSKYCTVSYMADEYNITKATISDSVKSLLSKGLIEKLPKENDTRSYIISLSDSGKNIIDSLNKYSSELFNPLNEMSTEKQENLWGNLSEIITKLHNSNIISMQRMCFSCKYYKHIRKGHYCGLLEKEMKTIDIRLDCPEHEQK